jgi:hypothetical protein
MDSCQRRSCGHREIAHQRYSDPYWRRCNVPGCLCGRYRRRGWLRSLLRV